MIQEITAPRPAHPMTVLSALGGGQTNEVERVRAFWRRVERHDAGTQISFAGLSGADKQLIIVNGWACEMRILPDGRRQIFGFLLPGDAIDRRATSSLGRRGVVALTRLEVISPSRHWAHEGGANDELNRALDEAAAQREERLYDHMVRMGRLSAKERVLHLLLELCERLEKVGLAKGDTFKLPLTQEVFADTVGLSVVHINRTLKQLRQEGCISLKSGMVTLHRRSRLAPISCYQPAGTWSETPLTDSGDKPAMPGHAASAPPWRAMA